MTWPPALPLFVLLPLSFGAGLLVGIGYFRAIRVTSDLIVNGGAPLRALALTLGRLACLGAFLYATVLVGSVALIAAFAGIMVARTLMLRQRREAKA